ncbi:unnamed protein product [Ilex paraguariensis]|uniref:Uncharacterized protein n=1 Tax=Ilex paraguariensis TaxID=185542 RepID=A0ABC8TT80_9AQUA
MSTGEEFVDLNKEPGRDWCYPRRRGGAGHQSGGGDGEKGGAAGNCYWARVWAIGRTGLVAEEGLTAHAGSNVMSIKALGACVEDAGGTDLGSLGEHTIRAREATTIHLILGVDPSNFGEQARANRRAEATGHARIDEHACRAGG